MASNNQRAPSAPPPQRWANDSKKNSKDQQKLILGQVKEMFELILKPEVILSVVQNCKWELQPSIDALIMLSENAEMPLNRAGANSSGKGGPSNLKTPKTENREESYQERRSAQHKSNLDRNESTWKIAAANSLLYLNDVELQRQKEEFRKFELLKKDLAEKGIIPSNDNENLSKTNYSQERDKIPQAKLQHFGQTWSTGKGEGAKVYFCSEVENSANVNVNQLWGNPGSPNSKKAKETNSRLDNLFGSKLQFSRDLPDNKIGSKGTIPKNSKPQTNTDPAILFARNAATEDSKSEGSQEKLSSASYNTAEYSSADFSHDFAESKAHEQSHQQQVAQFDSNYDNETKTRAGNSKSNHKETESLCGLKVQYRLPGLENSSDDDADVVIEEESVDYPTQIPSLMSTNVCQFISSSTQSPPRNTRSEIFSSNASTPSASPKHNSFDDKLKSVTSSILDGYKVLVIMRGFPGSGKTHLATSIVRSTVGGDKNQFIFSSDDYFVMLGRGVYQYVRSKLNEAHKYNQKRACSALREGVSPVIIDNTHTQSWEMQPYVVTGVQNGYLVEVLEPNTPWARNLNELVKKNTHGAPKESIRKMMERYERNITGARLIEQFSLRYSAENFPPQMRRFPFFGEGREKNEKLKATGNKNRNRRKKRGAGGGTENLYSTQDEKNELLSESDKNMKILEDSNTNSKKLDDTLEHIVSNALMSANDALNKSLVDYCIETDSGDEIDSDKIPDPVENALDDNTSFDLMDQEDRSESNYSPPIAAEENAPKSSDFRMTDPSPSSSPTTSSSSSCPRKSANTLHQNLGAIGSERKGSVTAIDCENFLRNTEEKPNGQENVLSQCWDFTLLVNGRQIHSTLRPCERNADFETKLRKDLETETRKADSEHASTVIITEILDDRDLEQSEEDNATSEDPDSAITSILKKMDALEPETTAEGEVDSLNADFGSDLAFEEAKYSPEVECETQGSSSTIGSIFSMMKRTILGMSSEEKPPRNEDTTAENIMKYKRQTNDNSLSENDAFENEKSHREPKVAVKIDEKRVEDELSPSITIVGDSLSEKFLVQNLSPPKDKSNKDSRCVSEAVNFDTLICNEEEFFIEDTLSLKLSNEKKRAIKTRNCCTYSNIDSDNGAIKNLIEIIDPTTNQDSNSGSGSENPTETSYENLEANCEIERSDKNEFSEINDFKKDATESKKADIFCDILSEAVNRIISRQETERRSFSDDGESESSQTESSCLSTRVAIDDQQPKTTLEDQASHLLNTEVEPEGTKMNEKEEITSEIEEKTNTESKNDLEIDSELLKSPKQFSDPENDEEDNSSIKGYRECCKSPTISDTEREIDESLKPEVEKLEEGLETVIEADRMDKIKTPEIIDNINQVTWKEPPFPVPAASLNSLLEKSRKFEPVPKSDSSTNTSNYDFNVLYVGGTSEPEYKILETKNRNINSSPACLHDKSPPLKLMLDKSSMTRVVDILSGEESLESITDTEPMKELKRLMEMFPDLAREDIKEIYENLCSCNFNWAVDMILDGVPDHVTKYSKIEAPKIEIMERQTSSSDTGDLDSQNSTPKREWLDKLKQPSSSSESNDSDAKLQQQNSSPKKKKDRHKVSEETLELKRQIEEKMIINEATYNPHILRVKRWKNGEPDLAIDSKEEKLSPQISLESEEAVGDSGTPKSSESIDDFTEDDIEPEEMMELHLGQDFIKVLEHEFGNPEFQFPGGIFPVIQIKRSMAQQIHALWIESMDQQINAQQEQLDKMIEKDAEYARSLEQEEARSLTEPPVPNLSEIMDMEMALALYHNDLKKKLESETPNDMASRLTRQMLHEMFTDHDPETLDEILKAHNGNFKETVDVLETSTGKVVNRNNTLKKQKSLIDRAKKESIQSEEFNSRTSTIVVNPELGQSSVLNPTSLTYEAAMEEARISRMEAERQLLLRNENFNKAKEAIRRGDRDVAGYYSQMAKLHAKQRELANSTAASAFLAAQHYKMTKEQMREDTLDLHNLYVSEALQALEVFLDYQISRLNESTKRSINLYIITGRGARSSNGMSRIKPAVSKKLASKNIRFMDDNPGCLKVVIHRRSGAAG